MAIGMFLVFSPSAKHEWLTYLPLVGQQMQLESLMNGREIGTLPPLVLGIVTVILVVLVLRISTNRLHRDEILYGN
jgi:hypothetical protein